MFLPIWTTEAYLKGLFDATVLHVGQYFHWKEQWAPESTSLYFMLQPQETQGHRKCHTYWKRWPFCLVLQREICKGSCCGPCPTIFLSKINRKIRTILLFVKVKINLQASKFKTITRKQFRWGLLLWKITKSNRNGLDLCVLVINSTHPC